ncbi:MAG: hypothetical protein LBQ44_06335 [Treponema sp.]|jgi:hypothetical protein|nr:hypothetical protein [Treponema sp.]
MNKEKKFDCVKFKQELHEKAYKKSGAKDFREYIHYVNERANKSLLHKANNKNV